jgi:hypothetical protein
MAEAFRLPVGEVLEALDLAAAILALEVPRRSIKDRLRSLKAQRKGRPDDDDLWAAEFMLRAGQVRVTFDARSRTVTEKPSRRNRLGRRKTDHRLNAVLLILLVVWERNHGPVARWDSAPGLVFCSRALFYAGVTERCARPESLRQRLRRLRPENMP